MTMTNSPPSNSRGTGSRVFERLHPAVQRWVWSQGWTSLRAIQEDAAEPILRGDTDVIISAPTAGGKTEAAFLPIATRLAENDAPRVGCVCVSPLKALINDQADRLGSLFASVSLPLTPWHGDARQSKKKRLLRERNGVLLITPESLEAMFVRRGSQIPQLFHGLQFIVIDELHSFVGTERGRQLQSLMNRIELAIRHRVPRIALSATLGDMQLAAEVLRPGSGGSFVLVEGEGDGREHQMQVRGYTSREPAPAEIADSAPESASDALQIPRDLFKLLRGTSNLIFANSRGRVEELADKLRLLSDEEGVPNEFLAHHGNLSRELRHDAEQRIKDQSKPTSVVCTSTLELGIDIGSVTSIAQVGCPPSVAALRQRLGRSGRRGTEPAILRGFVVEEELHAKSNLLDTLRTQLVQSIAMIQLLLDRWCEPPAPNQLHLSTLVQQTLSVIAQHGSATARDLYRALCLGGPFQGIDGALFGRLLHCLGEGDLLTQTSDGTLTLGVRGEQLVDHYNFFAAFTTPEEYRLVADGKPLGSMPIAQPLAIGSQLIFAGRRWRVQNVDDSAKVIELTAARGGRAPLFNGGGFDVHNRVREEMWRIYSMPMVPRYLDSGAKELLAEGRRAFMRYKLDRTRIIDLGGCIYLFPWSGDRVLDTLVLQLTSMNLDACKEGVAVAVQNTTVEALENALTEISLGAAPTGAQLASLAHNQHETKYDWALTHELRCLDYASRHFDEPGARNIASELIADLRSG